MTCCSRNFDKLPRLRIVKALGQGSNGTVFLADVIKDDREQDDFEVTQFAVKCLPKRDLPPSTISLLRDEALIHSVAGHGSSYIVRSYGILEDEQYAYLVLDHCEDGDLFHLITEREPFTGRPDLATRAFAQLVNAIDHIHRRGVFHRDLKSENVLCKDAGRTLLLSDFGLASCSRWSKQFRCGSATSMSPECFNCKGQTKMPYCLPTSDIWSLGLLFINIFFARQLWSKPCRHDELFAAYVNRPEILRDWFPLTDAGYKLLKGMLEVEPVKRMTVAEVKLALRGGESLTTITPIARHNSQGLPTPPASPHSFWWSWDSFDGVFDD